MPTALSDLLLAALDDGTPATSRACCRASTRPVSSQVALHHRAVGGLSLLLDRHQAGSPALREQLRGAHREQQVRALRALADLQLIERAFEERGIRWVTFKGVVLAETAYAEPALRMFADLDVLVHPEDLEEAVRVLLAHGAAHLGAGWADLDRLGIAQVSMQLRHGTVLDLHWHPFSLAWARRAFPVDVDGLLRRARTVSVQGVSVRTLSPEDTVVHLGVHGCLSGAYRLLWLKDLDQACRVPGLSWDALPARVPPGRPRSRSRPCCAAPAAASALPGPALPVAPGGRLWSRPAARAGRAAPRARAVGRHGALGPAALVLHP